MKKKQKKKQKTHYARKDRELSRLSWSNWEFTLPVHEKQWFVDKEIFDGNRKQFFKQQRKQIKAIAKVITNLLMITSDSKWRLFFHYATTTPPRTKAKKQMYKVDFFCGSRLSVALGVASGGRWRWFKLCFVRTWKTKRMALTGSVKSKWFKSYYKNR